MRPRLPEEPRPWGVFTRLLTGAGRGGVASKGEVTTLGELGAYFKAGQPRGPGWMDWGGKPASLVHG